MSREKNALKFLVPPGIGDVSWLYSKFRYLSKLVNRDVIFYSPNQEKCNRSVYFCDLLPDIINGGIGINCNPIGKGIKSNTTIDHIVSMAENSICPLEVNSHLESGKRIEEYIPDLPIDYHYPLDIPQECINKAEGIISGMSRPIIAVYVSGLKTQTGAQAIWKLHEWSYFLNNVHNNLGGSIVFIGAEYDRERLEQIISGIDAGIPYNTIIGQHLGAALHELSLCDIMVSYPSGIGILANVLRVPGLMLLWKSVRLLCDTYADPKDLADDSYRVWVEPSMYEAVEWFSKRFQYLRSSK